MAGVKSGRREPAPAAESAVWFQMANGQEWHVAVGSDAYKRLVNTPGCYAIEAPEA